jgi:hypothetical protein
MGASLLQLGEEQRVIDAIDPQECAGGLSVVRSINTGTPQVRENYRSYMDQMRDAHMATDKALARHQTRLHSVAQQRLEDQQDSDGSQMLRLTVQNRVDRLISKMNDDVWHLALKDYVRASAAQKR